MADPWLSREQIDFLCEGLVQEAAKARYLARLGLVVKRTRAGRIVVLASNAEAVLGGVPAVPVKAGQQATRQPVKPNRDAFKLHYGGKR